MAVLIGTSGWYYPHWKGRFYPPGVPTSLWLDYYSQRFATVESNNAFYRLPEVSTFAKWAAVVPDDFTVAVKASRYLTHIRRLRDPGEAVRRLMNRATGLGSKLGPILLQLPPTLSVDHRSLAQTLASFPRGTRVAVEFRHPSWFRAETRALLEQHGAAMCWSDNDGAGPPRWRTAKWGYVRFHHGRANPASCYGRTALARWAEHLAEAWAPGDDVYVYFNNDGFGYAPRNAHQFAAAVRREGLSATRVPSARETPLEQSA